MAGQMGGAKQDPERGLLRPRLGPTWGADHWTSGTRSRRLYLSAQSQQVASSAPHSAILALLGQGEIPAPPLSRAEGGLRRPQSV